MPRHSKHPPSPSSSDSDENSKENSLPSGCYLIRVPKSINVKELNGYTVDLTAFGPSDTVVTSKSDPEKSFGYTLLSPGATNAPQLTLLKRENDDDGEEDAESTPMKEDTSFSLAGCINFYAYRTMPDIKVTPLVATSPNDPIEVIINRARGHSIKRKEPSSCTTTIEKASSGRTKKHKKTIKQEW